MALEFPGERLTPLRLVPRGGLCARCGVRTVAACAALDDWELQQLEAITVSTSFEDGQTIFEQGDEPRFIFNLTQGAIRLVKLLPNGRRQVVGFVFPGDMLGLSSHGAYTCSAEAIGKVGVCRFPRGKLLALLDEFPNLKTRLLDIAADELSEAQEQMLLLGRKSPAEKLASFLWRLHRDGSRCGGSEDRIDLAMSRSDIADYLGLTIETVSRTFTKLRNDGVISLDGAAHVVIENADALEELAEAMGD
ncbi:helix-turn-helix domain-containing protein [Emcibacter sp. SYSU 3D8]|uniref:helix-turn-helix domain-containing protein n=1 Tax=Emcibacter sp. SYSU 3D8 TaxID=3133969 RepID=UPI0031FEA21A